LELKPANLVIKMGNYRWSGHIQKVEMILTRSNTECRCGELHIGISKKWQHTAEQDMKHSYHSKVQINAEKNEWANVH